MAKFYTKIRTFQIGYISGFTDPGFNPGKKFFPVFFNLLILPVDLCIGPAFSVSDGRKIAGFNQKYCIRVMPVH
jgi:hypothetical protein